MQVELYWSHPCRLLRIDALSKEGSRTSIQGNRQGPQPAVNCGHCHKSKGKWHVQGCMPALTQPAPQAHFQRHQAPWLQQHPTLTCRNQVTG
jgi:hypothetical protein